MVLERSSHVHLGDFGITLGYHLGSFWHQVGAKVAPKAYFRGLENRSKQHEKKVTQVDAGRPPVVPLKDLKDPRIADQQTSRPDKD